VKAVVLCAGEGTRLRPLTYTSAKHLIPIANKPVIHYTLESLRAASLEEIGIIVSPNVEEEFRNALGDGKSWGVKIEYLLQREPKGLAHAVSCARDYVDDEPFLVYLGDNLLQNGVKKLITESSRSRANATIVLTEVEDPRSFGVAVLKANGSAIAKLVEKPQEPPSKLAVVGVYLFDPHIFEAIDAIKPSRRGELEITDAIQRLIDEGYRVMPHLVEGWWKDVGRPEDMLDANRLLLEDLQLDMRSPLGTDVVVKGRVIVAEDVVIKQSELRGPLIIGRGAQICDSFIGPFTALGCGVQIKQSEIEYSIVMEGATIEGVRRIDHSLIGRHVHLGRCHRPPEVYNFVIGDNSQVRLI
jgi:glucose-1-phosphate thymidylyltransferase